MWTSARAQGRPRPEDAAGRLGGAVAILAAVAEIAAVGLGSPGPLDIPAGTIVRAGNLVLLTLGTGVGGGIIIDDVNVEGAHSRGSECGHIIVDPSPAARMCPCGQAGHREAYASAKSLVARAEESLAAGAGGAMTFGGEHGAVGRAFLERVRAEVRSRTFPTLAAEAVIGYASLGGDAGGIGAAGRRA